MSVFAEIYELLKQQPDTANAVAAMAGSATAVIALFVSFISLIVSVVALKHQRRHNILTVRPLPEITVADFEQSLRVKLRNSGSGPLVVNSLRANIGENIYRSVIECLPDLPGRDWTNFSGAIDGRSLLPGSEITLVELTEGEEEILFNSNRDLARRALSLVSIEIKYTDVYGSKFKPYTKELDWFGRHFV